MVKEAVLSIFFRYGTVGLEYTTAYRLIKEWDVTTVTWLKAGSGAWDNAGGDYTEENKAVTGYAPEMSWEQYTVTEIVKQFLGDKLNCGFLIIPDLDDNNTGRNYISSDNTELDSLRPRLTVTYESTAIKYNNQVLDGLKDVVLNKTGSSVKLFVPFATEYSISLYGISGEVIKSIDGYGTRWHTLSISSESLPSGVYIINIHSGRKNLSGKYSHIK